MFSKEKEATFYQVTFLLLSALSDESLRICTMGSDFGGQRLVGFGETESQRVVQAPPGCLSHTVSLTTLWGFGVDCWVPSEARRRALGFYSLLERVTHGLSSSIGDTRPEGL